MRGTAVQYLPEEFHLTASDRATMTADFQYFHANPELSFQEVETSRALRARLEAIDLSGEITRQIIPVTDTGFACVLRNGPGPVVGYRADMDGLPVAERTGLAYASRATGIDASGKNVPVMHACGHDSHMTIALALARVFAAHPQLWRGTIVFVFQPSEENGLGARAMVEAGLWEKAPRPQIMYGGHVVPRPAGWVNLYPGGVLPGSDGFEIIVHGVGGHGSQPHRAVDPIVIGSAIVTRLQTIRSRMTDPDRNAVVSVGVFQAGSQDNIIPDTARLCINTRFRDEETRAIINTGIERIVRAEALAAGAPEPLIRQIRQVDATVNDDAAVAALRDVIGAEFGEENLASETFGFSEDFAVLGQAAGAQSVFWLFGGFSPEQLNPASGEPASNHSPDFYADPELSLEPAYRVGACALYSQVRADN
ncbi:amidohydrolase [Actinotignum sp. GS-2025g]|uniref:amidohydrolase n=1 Tax=Actinotignum TaxID=1653174 RepID=UPI00254F567B|nr:amidohydrolase [Actinotignum timonense]MDK8782159.1 amidohydrolase [Actinotignum timonense]MDY5137729.1 amidohydrolase [Actinotignum timonense]MDY5156842.1 amidohydrolase [Actinotignum timonense]